MGNPFVHIELNAADLGKARKFYKSIFDWKLTEMPGFGYVMIDVGEGVGGGMQSTQPGAPPGWFAYVGVASVKKTIEKARKNGAQILVEYQPVGTMGALGVFVDPNGAPLGVWESAAPAPAKKGAKKGGKKKTAAKPKKKGGKKK